MVISIDEKDKGTKSRHPMKIVGGPVIVWNKHVPNTEMDKFRNLIQDKYNKRFDSYWEFHKWSVENYLAFWEEVWIYFNIIASMPYNKVLRKTGDGFLDNEWFSGAKLNLAENILKIRDERLGLICEDELGNRETYTYAEIFEEVKLYAAAFRKLGLNIGDRVSYYMSNRKEALFSMLAALSIGAIWGGPEPYFGARASTRIMEMLDPKFIIAVDHFQIGGDQFYLLDNLKAIAQSLPNLEKIIIVNTKKETSEFIRVIPNSILIDDFLQSGRRPDGSVPDIVFEQLPTNHPTNINFTSGTTGIPKGVVHSAIAMLSQLRDFSLHLNLKSGDVLYLHCPVGWAVWDYHIPSLALGITLFLFNGCPDFNGNGMSIWETFARNKVNCAYLASAYIDCFDKSNRIPAAKTNLDSLRIVCLGASPVKPRHYEFLHTKVKKDLVVCSWYGSTEVFGAFSGLDLNTPMYECEIQGPSLGMDFQCYDETGNSVVGDRGDVVVSVPNPAFPTSLWKDRNNERLKELYLEKFKSVWTQNDECWINPKTKGIVITGRSDDTLKQKGQRFGSTDVYFCIDPIEELDDYICVGQKRCDGESRAVLFIKLKKGFSFNPQLREKVSTAIKEELTDECVPELILQVPDIPYNVNNKKMESTIRKIVESNTIPEVSNIKNPESLQWFCNIPEILDFYSLI